MAQEPTRAVRAVDELCAPARPAAHPADSNSSACAVEMSAVGKSQETAWKDVLDTRGLSAAAPILEEYGLSCENDMSLLDEEDLVVLGSKLKPFPSKLLRKWVQGLGTAETENRHASSDGISVGEYLDSAAFSSAQPGFGRDAMYVINKRGLDPIARAERERQREARRALGKKCRKLHKQVQDRLRQLQEMEPEDGLCFALLVAPITGAPTLVRADGVQVVAGKPELSEVDPACTLAPRRQFACAAATRVLLRT